MERDKLELELMIYLFFNGLGLCIISIIGTYLFS